MNLEGREVDVNSIVFVFVVCLFSRVVSKGRREGGGRKDGGERILMENGKYLTMMRYFYGLSEVFKFETKSSDCM